MGLYPSNSGGYYNNEGKWVKWVQTKRCFISCGNRCNCQPPGGLTYDPKQDKRVKQTDG